jgi:hypothetical protein
MKCAQAWGVARAWGYVRNTDKPLPSEWILFIQECRLATIGLSPWCEEATCKILGRLSDNRLELAWSEFEILASRGLDTSNTVARIAALTRELQLPRIGGKTDNDERVRNARKSQAYRQRSGL